MALPYKCNLYYYVYWLKILGEAEQILGGREATPVQLLAIGQSLDKATSGMISVLPIEGCWKELFSHLQEHVSMYKAKLCYELSSWNKTFVKVQNTQHVANVYQLKC